MIKELARIAVASRPTIGAHTVEVLVEITVAECYLELPRRGVK